MIKSFLLITFRILWRNKVTSFVNIFGLSIGITSLIFIMLYVQHETSYDKFNQNYDDIYRLEGDNYARLPPVVGAYVKDRLPEVNKMARLSTVDEVDVTYNAEEQARDIKHAQVNIAWADSTTFDVFTFTFLQGDPALSLRNPLTCVITESIAKNFFDNAALFAFGIALLTVTWQSVKAANENPIKSLRYE